jgi:hypothetical protein
MQIDALQQKLTSLPSQWFAEETVPLSVSIHYSVEDSRLKLELSISALWPDTQYPLRTYLVWITEFGWDLHGDIGNSFKPQLLLITLTLILLVAQSAIMFT